VCARACVLHDGCRNHRYGLKWPGQFMFYEQLVTLVRNVTVTIMSPLINLKISNSF